MPELFHQERPNGRVFGKADRGPECLLRRPRAKTERDRLAERTFAELVIERVPTRFLCLKCNRLQTLATSCDCHAPVSFTAGDEMTLESMQG